VQVRVEQQQAQVSITVADDGDGITQPYVSGLGISSMRRRADALGGSLQLVPRPGGGTLLTVVLGNRP
jgi:two-component system, NarL family, sensor kinase